MAISDLLAGGLYIALSIRGADPADAFHWKLWLYTGDGRGIQYHIRNIGSGWITDHGPTKDERNALLLCCLVQIATLDATGGDDQRLELDRLARVDDGRLGPPQEWTCRTWVLAVLERLREKGILRCTDVGAPEEEAFAFGYEHHESANANTQPRPVERSSCLA
ncbi:hypothetical protein HGRIS_013394 [Hohenbuehelia grisea]|uniref:Uncharacterized protein n=1 Tax=Hohenbuehelia grisea TaxID=104357 RepID=A0ABR3IVE3_9AGAR